VTRLRARRPGFVFRQEHRRDFLLFATSSRRNLRSTGPLIQWFQWALSQGIKRSRRKPDYSPQTASEVKNAWRCTSKHPYAFVSWDSVKQPEAKPLPGHSSKVSVWCFVANIRPVVLAAE